MARTRENINYRQEQQTNQENIIIQQKKERKKILEEMINLVKKTPYDAKIDFDCGLGWTKYYEEMKKDLLNKHQQLVIDYRQSELESDNYPNLTSILADLRKNISLIDSIWTNDCREMAYYQKMALVTCQHLLEWEN